ncbi:hypothetical protein [Sphingomonas alpina]|uniref:Uncharacterized protein n=1 Tax=Sphingomonas alpina TaxID=653931 RepID=A0A7H0LMX3_9SPHN|nr:hypothetical protein [Sphingomonas alpina]QNQ11026.1 hypothetical protein H3Z74_07645 [Sphingomonas alpina]
MHNPLAHADFAYTWGEGALKGVSGPRAWQCEVMEVIREHLQNPKTQYTPCRIARASGHGIGKSALIAMLIKWGLDTGVDTRVVVTANTENQLLTKTAPELAKWSNLSLTRDWFRVGATSLAACANSRRKRNGSSSMPNYGRRAGILEPQFPVLPRRRPGPSREGSGNEAQRQPITAYRLGPGLRRGTRKIDHGSRGGRREDARHGTVNPQGTTGPQASKYRGTMTAPQKTSAPLREPFSCPADKHDMNAPRTIYAAPQHFSSPTTGLYK